MSTNLGYPIRIGDSSEIQLVRTLTEKTIQGRVPWIKTANSITANLPAHLEVNFVTQPSLVGSQGWQLFTVRERGNELVRVSPPSIMTIAQGIDPSLVAAVEELFAAIHKASSADLDRAIESIKRL